MLVLTRKTNQQIVIDGRITVTVLKVEGNRVCLGIDAPREVSVNRAEIVFDGTGGITPKDALDPTAPTGRDSNGRNSVQLRNLAPLVLYRYQRHA